MHDLIQEMAWNIVHEESPKEPGKRSLLWHHSDISHVLMNNTGTGAIEAIVLRLPKFKVVPWNCTEAFNKMHGLRLLDFNNVMFSSGPKFLPNSLRSIRWSWYPSKSLPSGFEPHFLSKLEMRNSKLVRLWDGAQDLPNLKYVDLSDSVELTSIPDFTRIPNLEKLFLDRCVKLGEVHSSIAIHKKLKVLLLRNCRSIKSLPSKLEMDSLELFSISGCSKLKNIPEFGEHMYNLKGIYLHETAIEQIPSSIEHLVGLVELSVSDCKSLLGLPSAICNLKSLKILRTLRCSKLDKLPGDMRSLEELYLSGSAMREPLVAMKNLKNLSLHRLVDSRDGICCGLGHLLGIRRIRKSASRDGIWCGLGLDCLLGIRKSDSRDGIWCGSCIWSGSCIWCGRDYLLGIRKSDSGDGIWCGLGCLLGIGKIVDPDPWRLVLSSLTHSRSLTKLDLNDCNIGEGAIPDDIGCLSSLKELKLSGNNFVSLPSSIRFLYELVYLELERCKRLERLPDLPSSKYLFVNVNDCTSLNGLSDPSKLSEGANVYDFGSSCVNCFRLVEEGGWIWINRIFAMILTMATCPDNSFFRPPHPHRFAWPAPTHRFVWPGSEIPEWFDNRSVGDSIIVELPLPPQTCSDWVGIALCVVFEDSEYLEYLDYDSLEIYTSPAVSMDCPKFKVGHLGSQHLWVFYLPRDNPRLKDASGSRRFSFEGHYYPFPLFESSWKASRVSTVSSIIVSSIIKKCGARLVYQRDLEEFSRILKIPMPAALQASDDEEAGPISTS